MNLTKIRNDFPILKRTINNHPLRYFDSACMTLKPQQVIDTINQYYQHHPACAGRSIHTLGSEVTIAYENAREHIQTFINAPNQNEIVFTKNTTEGINLIAHSLPLKKNDIVLTTDKEHNSNLIPWQLLQQRKGIQHQIVPSNNDNTFNLETFESMMNPHVKLISMGHTSNLDGYSLPVEQIINIAHDHNALVLLDGAQSIPKQHIDVQKLNVDFFAFSFHKMLGPTGIGALYGKYHLLEQLQPFIVGGDTITKSTYHTHTLLPPPQKFEAGLQNYAGALGAAAAVRYINTIGKNNIAHHINHLNTHLTQQLQNLPGLHIIGPENPNQRHGILTFTVQNQEPHDIALHLDKQGIMVRSGVFCVHSWFNAQKIKGAVRISLYLYNTQEEITALTNTLTQFI